MKRAAIIVAGGKGLRMGAQLPKQFLSVAGIPILCRTIQKFLQYDPEIKIFLALPQIHMGLWAQLSLPYISPDAYTMVEGGAERFHSVKNALDKIPQDVDLIAVHDGVRPLVSVRTIAAAFTEATLKGNAIPCIAPPESIRVASGNGENHAIDRSTVKLIQTPQVFEAGILRKAYCLPYTPAFTDDASVVETSGEKINLIDGDRENIKITTIEDLKYAEYILSQDTKQ
ncbi:MAG: 2-C-methyl-D-erythritol 4-phosphate cytidylyltransferase [Bacteroidales bacterium]|nr:2-C-methyl-D-erythritol 4-phosphate cytidylyltransferase [Bacteroidales bacterium]